MEPIGGDVRRELGRFGPAAGIAELVAAWPRAVGPAVARNAWPARIARDGTLHVATSSSAWAFELAQLAPELLERLRELCPDAMPTAVRFAVGNLPEPPLPSADEPSARVAPAGPAERRLAEAMTAGIGDEDLRALVARAAAASLAARADDRPV